LKLLLGFLRLVRWPNLVFIALTQCLFEFCIYHSIFPDVPAGDQRFFLLLTASVLIAAAGYIINDYFDLNIDQVNKPDKVVVNTLISRRWVIFWHLLLSLLGFFCTVSALPLSEYWHLILLNLASILLLWLYSTNLKKELLIGNVLISLLTAWVIGILFLARYPLRLHEVRNVSPADIRFFRYTILYTSFAFVISLIREVIKDMEDIDGDRRYGCRTMPIRWGINASKVFVAVWTIVLIAVLVVLQFYVLPFGWWMSAVYCLLLIIVPLIYLLKQLYVAGSAEDYHKLSTLVKAVMFTGIISMTFFLYYL
jgi:4-hydroxybenzoate polyprenyltransferase